MKAFGRFINVAEQEIAAGGPVLFNNITAPAHVFEYRPNGVILIKKPGTYMIYTNFNIIAEAVGTTVINMEENSLEVPGAQGAFLAGAIGDTGSVSFNAIATVLPSPLGAYAEISFVSDVASSVDNANVIIEKVV